MSSLTTSLTGELLECMEFPLNCVSLLSHAQLPKLNSCVNELSECGLAVLAQLPCQLSKPLHDLVMLRSVTEVSAKKG